jgi:hypothetical protein
MFAARIIAGALFAATAVGLIADGSPARADTPPKPVAGQQMHFPNGTWSALPQVGPDGKVRQCVMVALRPRAITGGVVDTRLSIDISAGSGLAFAILDDKLPTEAILDDQSEVILDGHSYPAVGFTVEGSNSLALHPGDAAAVLSGLAKTIKLRLRSDGDGVDTGDIPLNLPADALAWLVQCGKQFNIALDHPTDPNAPPLPAAHPRSPEIASVAPNASGLPGSDDKEKIAKWDASELRNGDGRVGACYIRVRYGAGSDSTRLIMAALFTTRSKGLTMALKDTVLKLNTDDTIDAALTIDKKPFTGFSARALSDNEIGFFPQHGDAFGAALGDGVTMAMKSPVEGFEFDIPPGVVPWLRACSRRWGWSFDAAAAQQ